MSRLKKVANSKWGAFLLLVLAFLFLRLCRLDLLPIFGDEATYLHWSLLIRQSWDNFFISFSDGKEPLYFVFSSFFLWLPFDPLLVGRLAALSCGLANVVLLILIGAKSAGFRAGYAAALCYLCSYYFFQIDRQVNPEALAGTLSLAVLYACLWLWEERHRKALCCALGLLLGICVLTKLSCFALWLLPPLILLARGFKEIRKWPKELLVSYGIAGLFLLIRIFEPQERTFNPSKFFISLGELREMPLKLWQANMLEIGSGLELYVTWPVFLLLLLGLHWSWQCGRRELALAGLYGIALGFAMLVMGSQIYARYLMIPLCLCFAALPGFLQELANRSPKAMRFFLPELAIIALSVISLCRIGQFLINPERAAFTAKDRFQYYEGPFSGSGVREIVDAIKKECKDADATVFVPFSFGHPGDSIPVLLSNESNLRVLSCWWYSKGPLLPPGVTVKLPKSKFQPEITVEDLELDKLGATYYVDMELAFPARAFLARNPGAKLILRTGKGEGDQKQNSLYLFRVR